jgi:hypothetical protein
MQLSLGSQLLERGIGDARLRDCIVDLNRELETHSIVGVACRAARAERTGLLLRLASAFTTDSTSSHLLDEERRRAVAMREELRKKVGDVDRIWLRLTRKM